MSRILTKQQVLRWRDNWSVADRALVEAAVGLLPAETTFYETSSYAAARVEGRVAVYVSPGYLTWPNGRWSADIDPDVLTGRLRESGPYVWCALSTFRPHGSARPTVEEFDEACPDCFQVPAVNGTCACF